MCFHHSKTRIDLPAVRQKVRVINWCHMNMRIDLFPAGSAVLYGNQELYDEPTLIKFVCFGLTLIKMPSSNESDTPSPERRAAA